MIIDCHMHYDPEMFPLERMVASMESNGIDRTALIATMVEPFLLGARRKKVAVDFMRVTLMNSNPLGQMVYQSTVSKKGYFLLVGEKYRIYDTPDNGTVVDAIERYPDKLMGWIFINPAVDKDPVGEIEKWSSNPRMIGVKAHPFWHRYSVELLDSAAGWCTEHGFPLLIHLGCRGGGGDYQRLPEKYPDLKIIYAHAGIPYYRKLWAYIKDRKNVFVDLSSPAYMNQRLLNMAVDFLGAEKCLYGNDGPYGGQAEGEDFDYGVIKHWIEGLPVSDREREMIFSENFEAVRKR